MNFLLLKEVIMQLKRKFRCPKCRKSYSNRDIMITNVNEGLCDVVLGCRKCEVQVFANISLLPSDDEHKLRKHLGIKVSANSYSYVSENDVLDVKNFLRDFSGNFKSLFKIEKSNDK